MNSRFWITVVTLTALLSLQSACRGRGKPQQTSSNAILPNPAAKRVGDTIQFEPNSPQLSRIQIAAAETQSVPIDEVGAPGKIEANPNRVSRMALPVAGRIQNVLVGLGDSVEQGQPIIVIASPEVPPLQSAYRQAEANVAQAGALLVKAEADLQRARDLFENRAGAQKEVLAGESLVAQAKAARTQAEAARDESVQRLRLLGIQPGSMDQTITVPATVSGKVMEISVVPGEYRTDTSQPVMTLADLSTVWVGADIPESAIRFIRIGEPVAITLPAFPNRTFTGRVTRINDVADAQTRTIKVRAELSNPDGQFRPEMFAQVRSKQGQQTLPTVPKGAVLQQEGQSIVYIERAAGRFQEVPVTIAWQGPDRGAIKTGVGAGDRVVIDGAMLLKAAVP